MPKLSSFPHEIKSYWYQLHNLMWSSRGSPLSRNRFTKLDILDQIISKLFWRNNQVFRSNSAHPVISTANRRFVLGTYCRGCQLIAKFERKSRFLKFVWVPSCWTFSFPKFHDFPLFCNDIYGQWRSLLQEESTDVPRTSLRKHPASECCNISIFHFFLSSFYSSVPLCIRNFFHFVC